MGEIAEAGQRRERTRTYPSSGEKNGQYIYGGGIATCKSFRRSTKSTGTPVLRSVSALDHDSWRGGLPNGVAGCGDHGTHWSVSLCLASSTFFPRAGRFFYLAAWNGVLSYKARLSRFLRQGVL